LKISPATKVMPKIAASARVRGSCRARHSMGSATAATASIQIVAV